MEAQDVKTAKFEELYKQRPGGVSFWFGFLRFLFIVPGYLLLIGGIGLIIASVTGVLAYDIVAEFPWLNASENLLRREIREEIQAWLIFFEFVLGIFCTVVGILFIFISGLCRRIIERNNYIFEL